VEELEALERVRALDLLAEDVEDGVDELGTLGVVALGPVVAGTALAVDKGVGAEERGEGARADEVDDTRLEVDLDRAGDVLLVRGLVKVDRDCELACARASEPAQLTLVELLVIVADVLAVAVEAVLLEDVLPEGGTDLVAGLSDRDADNLPSHDYLE
jgi:hypothetical protein